MMSDTLDVIMENRRAMQRYVDRNMRRVAAGCYQLCYAGDEYTIQRHSWKRKWILLKNGQDAQLEFENLDYARDRIAGYLHGQWRRACEENEDGSKTND